MNLEEDNKMSNKTVVYRGVRYPVMSYKLATKKRRELGNALRKKGYEIVHSYKDAMANGARYSIEVGKYVNAEYLDMRNHRSKIHSIIKRYFPTVKYENYRGTSRWLIRFQWKVKYNEKM